MASPRARLPYEPPALRKVQLVREELAVAICKTQTSTTGPTVGCWKANCKAKGS